MGKPVLLSVDDDPGVSRAVARDLRRRYGEDFRVLRAMRGIAPEITLAALIEEGNPDFVATARAADADMIAPEFHMVTVGKVAAAHAIARCISPRDLSPDYIVPSVFNSQVVTQVAEAVEKTARKQGVARNAKGERAMRECGG